MKMSKVITYKVYTDFKEPIIEQINALEGEFRRGMIDYFEAGDIYIGGIYTVICPDGRIDYQVSRIESFLNSDDVEIFGFEIDDEGIPFSEEVLANKINIKCVHTSSKKKKKKKKKKK